MIGFKVDQAKTLFFDREVAKAVNKSSRQALSKFGAFVRIAARRSIRKRKKVADPGKPPTNRTGILKKLIFFAYEPERQSVVIGPVKTNAKGSGVPDALEYGGKSKRRVRRGKRWVNESIDIAARPYMGPAFDANLPKVDDLWKDSIR